MDGKRPFERRIFVHVISANWNCVNATKTNDWVQWSTNKSFRSIAYITVNMLSCYDRRAVLSFIIYMLFDYIVEFHAEKRGRNWKSFKLPVLVETTATFFGQMLCPDIDECTTTEWCFDVTDGSNNNHWWSFNDSHCLNNFLLVDL